jgi:hypothetical protein
MQPDDHEIFVYPPPKHGAPYVVVTISKGREPNAQFANSNEEATKLAAQIHELLWRAQHILPNQ